MSHPEQNDFIKKARAAFPLFFIGGRVLEIGSLDINGSARAHFKADKYIGLDVGPGPSVDVVCEGQKYDAPDSSFDTVLSCECLEHNPYWAETIENMFRLCKPGGLVLMTCAGLGRPEHGTRRTTPQDAPLIQWDYYKKHLQPRDILDGGKLKHHSSTWMMTYHHASHDLYLLAFKNGAKPPENARKALRNIKCYYTRKNWASLRAIKDRTLMWIFGEQRYMAGSLLPWKRRRFAQ